MSLKKQQFLPYIPYPVFNLATVTENRALGLSTAATNRRLSGVAASADKSVEKSQSRHADWFRRLSTLRSRFGPVSSSDSCSEVTEVEVIASLADFENVWPKFVNAVKRHKCMGVGLYPESSPLFLTLAALSGPAIDVSLEDVARGCGAHTLDLADYLAKPIWRLLDDPAITKVSVSSTSRVLLPLDGAI